jgi:hypothetical protein
MVVNSLDSGFHRRDGGVVRSSPDPRGIPPRRETFYEAINFYLEEGI